MAIQIGRLDLQVVFTQCSSTDEGRNQMRTLIQKFRQDESGASMVEYGLLVALIAVVLIASVTSLGTGLQGVFDSIVAAFP